MLPSRANLDDLASLHSFVTWVHRYQHPSRPSPSPKAYRPTGFQQQNMSGKYLKTIVLQFSFPLPVGGHTL